MSHVLDYLEEELEKCKKSPYYFATKYLLVEGKPFVTPLNEETFNNLFNRVPNPPKFPEDRIERGHHG